MKKCTLFLMICSISLLAMDKPKVETKEPFSKEQLPFPIGEIILEFMNSGPTFFTNIFAEKAYQEPTHFASFTFKTRLREYKTNKEVQATKLVLLLKLTDSNLPQLYKTKFINLLLADYKTLKEVPFVRFAHPVIGQDNKGNVFVPQPKLLEDEEIRIKLGKVIGAHILVEELKKKSED